MTVSWNDNALARTLGTNDPATLEAWRAEFEAPDSDLALSITGWDGNSEPIYAIANAEDEIERLVLTHRLGTPHSERPDDDLDTDQREIRRLLRQYPQSH